MIHKSSETLTELAVRAVFASSQRAIVLGGDAGLCMEALERAAPDDPLLIAYARDNILFVPTAPHEWLFPQVAAIVHHGGAGTTTASLRSGVPTIVTPILGDQFDNAKLINQLGVGIGVESGLEKMTHRDLSAAIDAVLNNGNMQKTAAQIRTVLLAEPNGAFVAVQQVEAFWHAYVDTGRFFELFPGPPPRRTLTGPVVRLLDVLLVAAASAFTNHV